MAQENRFNRRVMGMLEARLPDLGLDRVVDPRSKQGQGRPVGIMRTITCALTILVDWAGSAGMSNFNENDWRKLRAVLRRERDRRRVRDPRR